MKINEAIITFFGQKAKVCCDGKCSKAWGINNRPASKLSDEGEVIEWLKDSELGTAPIDPGTEEGGDCKPKALSEFPNNWCVRACERSSISKPGKWDEPLELEKF